jgi:hypothetical protein
MDIIKKYRCITINKKKSSRYEKVCQFFNISTCNKKQNIFDDTYNKKITGKQLNESNFKFYVMVENDENINLNKMTDVSKNKNISIKTFDDTLRSTNENEKYICLVEIPDNAKCSINYNRKLNTHTITSSKIIYKNARLLKNLYGWNDINFCLEVVDLNLINFKYVKEQTDFICSKAVKLDGMYLKYVKEQTKNICLKAVKQNGLALIHVDEQTKEICLEAVKQNGLSLKHVKMQRDEICMEAVKQEGNALQYVLRKNKQMCYIAVKQNRDSICYVNNKYYRKIINKNNNESYIFYGNEEI